jgi:hypothetical protein
MVDVPSPRPFPATLPPIAYPPHFDVRRVTSNGCMTWRNAVISVSSVLIGGRGL